MRSSLSDLRSANPRNVQAFHLKGENHFYPWTQPELVSKLIADWLEQGVVPVSSHVSAA